MADNIADDKESLKLEEYILQNKLNKRIAAVDKEYLAFVPTGHLVIILNIYVL